MTDDEKDKLYELLEQITELLPEFDAVMLSEGALILTSREHLEAMSESIGVDINLDEEAEEEFLKLLGMDDEDDGSGGILQ